MYLNKGLVWTAKGVGPNKNNPSVCNVLFNVISTTIWPDAKLIQVMKEQNCKGCYMAICLSDNWEDWFSIGLVN